MSPAAGCRDDARRARVRGADLNGLDFLEVSDDQRRLTVHFLGKAPARVERGNVVVEGGRRIRGLRVVEVEVIRERDPELDDRLLVHVDRPGDFSTYTLRMVEADARGNPTRTPLRGFDARYAALGFTFKAGCPSPLDCAPAPCPAEPPAPPAVIDYLARDYPSFRQLMLDRMSILVPGWTERHVPDLGIALVELLAYAGDELSYYQDAVATEAYLGTARRRTSVRRHARLVDYALHEGCNARAFVHVGVDGDADVPRRGLAFLTAWKGMPAPGIPLSPEALAQVPRSAYEVFEPVAAQGRTLRFRLAHNEIRLYTWGQRECCLPRGATSATLRDAWAPAPAPEPGTEPGAEEPSTQQAPGARTPVQDPAAPHPAPAPSLRRARPVADLQRDEPDRAEEDDRPRRRPRHRRHHPDGHRHHGRDRHDHDHHDHDRHDHDHHDHDHHDHHHHPRGHHHAPGERPRLLSLQAGDLLLLEEVIGPRTGLPADADPRHRHVVRLTRVTPAVDELDGTPVLEVEWGPGDALPFPLCVSAVGRPPRCVYLEPVSVARGNVVLVDHGESADEVVGCVEPAHFEVDCGDCGCPPEVEEASAPFRPALSRLPLTFRHRLPRGWSAASAAAPRDPAEAVPHASARFVPTPPPGGGAEQRKPADDSQAGEAGAAAAPAPPLPVWRPRADLLGSWPLDRHFVVEVEDDGATLRFGDGEMGMAPDAGTCCHLRYRVGNGAAGNVGAGAIALALRRDLRGGIAMLPRNPLAAGGGVDPQPLDDARLLAPFASRGTLQRAVAAEDYARIAERHPRVQRAAAFLGWTGSWEEVTVAIDTLGSEDPPPQLLAEVAALLEPFRRIGHDVRVVPAAYVPLEVGLKVVAGPGYLRGHVLGAVRAVLVGGALPDGTLPLFHPDRLSFGGGVWLSALVGAVQGVEGVDRVEVTAFNRLFAFPNHELENGVLPLAPTEIARLDADPGAAENGTLTIQMAGGR